MFGAGNYCEHHFNEGVEPGFGATVKVWSEHRSNDAEIAVIDSNGNLVTGFPGCPESDQVRGWVTPDEMLEVMNWAAAQSKDTISLSEKVKELGEELEKYKDSIGR